MQSFGQTLLHLVEIQRMVQKGDAHSQASACLLYATKQKSHKTDGHCSLSLSGCSYCLCSCSGIGGPGDIHNWGYGVRNEPMSLHHMDPDGWSLMS